MKTILVSNSKNNDRYSFIAENITIIESSDIVSDKDFVTNYLKDDEAYVIYIPTTRVADSALSYTGVQLALWIYMHLILNQNLKFHIILLGSESKGSFFEHCRYANIILAPNVHYVVNSKEAIEYFINCTDTQKYYSKEILIESLKGINVAPPTTFNNTHTLTNEWCIHRWSKALDIEVHNNEFDDSLYLTYLKTILSINDSPKVSRKCISNKKILIVDDEMNKGWREFFESLLSGYVNCIGENFKNAKSKNEIIDQIMSEVKVYNPDIVILDLRLHNTDHNNSDRHAKLTGINVLEEIKSFNNGIQVIGFTASTKAWNLLALQEKGIDGFIIKESPQKSIEPGYTERSINRLIEVIEKASEKTYLKEIFIANREAKDKLHKLNKQNHLLDKEMTNLITGYLELVDSSLFTTQPNHETAFMYYFLILEAFAKYMIDDKGEQGKDKLYYVHFRRDEKKYLMRFNERTGEKTNEKFYSGKAKETQNIIIPYNQKLYNMIDYVGLRNINLYNLVQLRNDFFHPDPIEKSKSIELSRENVVEIMNVVCALINNYR